jgi:hypothetical protein
VKDGVVDLAAIVRKGGKVDHAQFSQGIFKVTQTRTTTDLTLLEPPARFSAATVPGTRWLVQDSCSSGVVSVRDEVKRKTIVPHAGKTYLAKPKRR